MDRATARPRKANAIYSATLALLAEHGYDALTIEAVATRAGVNKTTIYRTWSSKDEVFADSVLHASELTFAIPDTGSFRGDLIELGRQINRLLTEVPTRRIIAAIVAATPDRPATAAAARTFFADRLHREQAIADRAIARGELPQSAAQELALIVDLIAGNLWLHTFVRSGTAGDGHISRVVDIVLTGLGTPLRSG